MSEVPCLSDLCSAILLRDCSGNNREVLEKTLHLWSRLNGGTWGTAAETLQHRVLQKIRDHFSMLIENYYEEELISLLGMETWELLMNKHRANLEEKRIFTHITQGQVLSPKMVDFDEDSEYFPLEVLEQGAQWPKRVDPGRREAYLSDQDFFQVFQMTKSDFYSLPSHLRIRHKKEKRLF